MKEKGSVAVFTILFLPVLFAVLILLIDIGWLVHVRQVMQNAADLGALAGVQELDLEKLAEGKLELTDRAEWEAERIWRANLEGFWDGKIVVEDEIEIHNPAPRSQDRISGETHRTPTVCIVLEARVPVPLPLLQSSRVRVHADASVQRK